jgi:hypothetical protein
MKENGWGKERKINDGYADPGDRWRMEAEANSMANGRLFNLYFIHATSPCTVAPDIHVVRVVSILTSYIILISSLLPSMMS